MQTSRLFGTFIVFCWIMLFAVTLLYALAILLPFFALGLNQMTEAQILTGGMNLSWHPFYSAIMDALNLQAEQVIVLWILLAWPLLIGLGADIVVKWPDRTIRANLRRLFLIAPTLAVVVLENIYGGQIIAWIMD